MNQFYTILTAMLPIGELRGSIPLALTIYHLSPFEAFFWSVIGNMIPVFFLLWFWQALAQWLMNNNLLANRFFTWLFNRTRKKISKSYEKYSVLALAIFVAIPLPMTGAWSGTIAAFIFDIPYWKAILYIFGGVLIAGVVVTLATVGVTSLAS